MISLLEYAKIIITKVSFRKDLMIKEYKKLSRSLSDEEQKELDDWMESRFSSLSQ